MFGLILQKMFATAVMGMTVTAYGAGYVFTEPEVISSAANNFLISTQPATTEELAEHVMDGIDEVYGWDGFYANQQSVTAELPQNNKKKEEEEEDAAEEEAKRRAWINVNKVDSKKRKNYTGINMASFWLGVSPWL